MALWRYPSPNDKGMHWVRNHTTKPLWRKLSVIYRVSQKTCNIFLKRSCISLENDIVILKTYLESGESSLSTCQIINFKCFWRYAYFSKDMSGTSSTDFKEFKKRTNAYLHAITKHSHSLGLPSCSCFAAYMYMTFSNMRIVFFNHIL